MSPCRACGQAVAFTAEKCPKCGAFSPWWSISGLILLIIVMVGGSIPLYYLFLALLFKK